MLGFNKKKRMIEGSVEFEAEVEIDRPVGEVFPLVDTADPRFCHVQRGATITRVEEEADRFDLTTDMMEGVAFQFKVIERVEGSIHPFECTIKPRINDLVKGAYIPS